MSGSCEEVVSETAAAGKGSAVNWTTRTQRSPERNQLKKTDQLANQAAHKQERAPQLLVAVACSPSSPHHHHTHTHTHTHFKPYPWAAAFSSCQLLPSGLPPLGTLLQALNPPSSCNPSLFLQLPLPAVAALPARRRMQEACPGLPHLPTACPGLPQPAQGSHT
eukprot:92324-Chlamydomonas_euryale.AAC.4